MIISEETVKKLAHLSRVDLDPKALKQMQGDLGQIVGWMDKLQELDTTNVEPLSTLCEEENVFRSDIAMNEFGNADALLNAPDKEDGLFKVPKVIN